MPPLKKARSLRPATHWGVIGELLALASSRDAQPPPTFDLSTQWDPVALRSSRPANTTDLLARGCRCHDLNYRFPEWVLRGCPLGALRFRTTTCLTSDEFIAGVRHDALFQLLSLARAAPVNRSSIFRGFIDPGEPEVFHVAAGLGPGAVCRQGHPVSHKHSTSFRSETRTAKTGSRTIHQGTIWTLPQENASLIHI